MTQRKGLRGILALLCAMTLLIGAIGPAWATEAAPLTDGGTQEVTPAPDGETPAPAPETPKTIRSWDWVDPNGYLKEGVLKQPDVNAQNPVQFSGVTVFLPKEITAKVEGSEEDVTIPVEGWECLSFGDMSTGGDYTFTAKLGQGYTLKEGVAALEVQVKLGQPVTNGAGDTTGNAATSEVITVDSWLWVDSMQALSDDGKMHLKEEITDENLPEIQKLLPQSIQAGENIISLTWTYSKETKTFTAKLPDGYALKEGAAPLAVAVVVEEVMVLPEGASTLYVGQTPITGSGYWKTTADGKLEPGSESDYNVHYDGNGTLTLNGATIQGGTSTVSVPYGAGIYAQCNSGESVSLTIKLIGNNTITGSYGIFVDAEVSRDSYGTDATLTITGENNGSLEVSGSDHGIFVKSGTGDASLTIENASVDAKTTQTSSGYAGVCVQSSANATGSPNISLSVNGGSLTASGGDGISFYVGSSSDIGATTSLTISDNAIVRAENGIKASRVDKPTPSGTGIVFDGKNGTVYRNVTLQEDLTINQGETLTIPDGASLTTNDKLIVNGGTLDGKDRIIGTVKYVPVIITQPTDANVTAGNTATFKITATGDELTYQWQQSTDNGSTWMDISGATTDTYTTAATTAEMNGYQYRCVVTGKDGEVTSNAATLTVTTPTVPVTGVALDHTELSLFTGDSAALTATVKPDDAANKKVTWSSSESGVAAVDGNGKVTALKAGTTTITVTTEDGSKTATCKVTVSDKTYGISVDTGVDFGTVYANYTAPKAKTVTIKNTGNQIVTLNQPASTDSFEVGKLSKTELPAGETATFTVQPKSGLTANTYDGTIEISGTSAQGSVKASVSVKFTVKKELQVTLNSMYEDKPYKTTYNGREVTPAAIPKTATCDGHAVSGTWRFADGNPKNAGTYENIVLEFTPEDDEKYAEASIELDVVIEKKPLTAYVKLSSTKIGQGKKLPTVSLAFSGLVSGEKLDLEVDPKFEGMPSNSKKAGTYTIKLKNVDEMQKAIEKLDVAKNYDLSDLKFTPAKLSIVSSSNPVTADTSNIGLWTAVMVISGIGLIVLLVVMVVLNKKSKRRRSRRRRTPPRQED